MFLNTAADKLQPLLDRLIDEGAIIVQRPANYPPAEDALAYLDEFASLKARLPELNDADLEHKIVLWHKTATASLIEVRDYRLLTPGMYLRTYVLREDQKLDARFAAIQAGLSADISNARDLAERL
jgi:hypothetical protein